jgi:hypothetical protein
MKTMVIVESQADGQLGIKWQGIPVDANERINLVHALRMFANGVEASPLQAAPDALENQKPRKLTTAQVVKKMVSLNNRMRKEIDPPKKRRN